MRLYSEAGRGGGTTTPWRSRRLVARPYSCVIPLTSEGPGSPIPGPKFAGVWKEGRPVAKRRSYTKEQRIEAVTLAQAAGIPEASKRLGIPQGTIKRWVAQARGSTYGDQTGAEALKAMTEEVRAKAVAEATEAVTEHISERLKQMADELYQLAHKAIQKVDVAISDPNEVPKGKKPERHDRDGAAWVRSLVGVMAQGIEKAQLLTGKATGRNEVVERREYHITEEIVARNPDVLDSIFGPSRPGADRPGLEDRGGESSRLGLGELRGPDVPAATASEVPGAEADGG